MRRVVVSAFFALGVLLGAAPAGRSAVADDAPGAAPAESSVGIVTGDKVNLRVGPRTDDAPVTQLEQGTALVIVERVPEWFGVRVPAGFQAAVAAALTEIVDDDHVRIVGVGVNLRVRPPAGDRAYPAFRDHPVSGSILPVIAREGDWVWVEAPEATRAYIATKYVKEVGTLSENVERLSDARGARVKREEARALTKKKSREVTDDSALRAEVGAISNEMAKVRSNGGYETAPVAVLADRLDSCVEAHAAAPAKAKALAKALAGDLDREMQIRVAYADEILLKKRMGQPPPEAPKPASQAAGPFDAKGGVRWESAPGLPEGGLFVLWSGERPSAALKWAGGDLRSLANWGSASVKGRTTGAVVAGLPIVEVESILPDER